MGKKMTHYPHACLPFVELGHKTSIEMGPIIFWPASKYKTFTSENFQSSLESYFESIAQVKTRIETKTHLINTIKLPIDGTTCISIDNQIKPDQKEMLLIDAIYLLYFACTFRNLYYNNEIPSFEAFRKMIPASNEFVQNVNNWKDLHISENEREETICIHLIDQEICVSLGKILMAIYGNGVQINPKLQENYKRMIRAIRYLVDRFFQRFVNLFKNGLAFSEMIFEPEDMIFLATSFEALFDIDDKQASADFKHKLRSLLHLKWSRPVELFWKWVDQFYEIKRQIVHCGQNPDPLFKLNPNFEISHVLIGIKLFIYSVYVLLHKYKLMIDQSTDPFSPIDFKWIHPEEVFLFFWSEVNLLKKIDLLLTRAFEEKKESEEIFADIHFLSNLFVSMQERYFQGQKIEGIKFIPSEYKDIQKPGERIKKFYHQIITEQPEILSQLFHEKFLSVLENRLSPHVMYQKR